jgi:hypothetical protein
VSGLVAAVVIGGSVAPFILVAALCLLATAGVLLAWQLRLGD